MADILILVVVGVIWLFIKAAEGASSGAVAGAAAIKDRAAFSQERAQKYGARVVDTTKSLFDRNNDIIANFESMIQATPPQTPSRRYGRYGYSAYNYQSHYLENHTRDCLNEISLAENKAGVRPGVTYLVNWRRTAPANWVELSNAIEKRFDAHQRDLQEKKQRQALLVQEAERQADALQREISTARERLKNRIAKRKNPLSIRDIRKRNADKNFVVDDLTEILTPSPRLWSERISEILNDETPTSRFPLFREVPENKTVEALNVEIVQFNSLMENDEKLYDENIKFFNDLNKRYRTGDRNAIIERINYVLDDVELPRSVPQTWSVDFDANEGIAIVEVKLPDVVHEQIYKKVILKTGTVLKPLNQKEFREKAPCIHPAILLRIAHELYRNDEAKTIKLLVVNGLVEFDDPTTGNKTKTYTASMAVTREQILSLNLLRLDPIAAFFNLKGKSAGKLIDIIPVTPIMSLDRNDKRFIETKEVLNKLGTETNLASMDWKDFESLIAELFEKEFAKEGAEVKVTQASRDRGVDAVVFDPDPIKGGKFIIQAKRYTNTVDVSAVRDLCAVVKKEGASKGILVTTSTYGSDAYTFAQNEPVTLLNGAELLGLLQKHGYTFRINLAEARKLTAEQARA